MTFKPDVPSIQSAADVSLSNPATNQSLVYDASTGKWKNTGLTKTLVGLPNVDNTSDTDKPISTATKAYVDNGLASRLIFLRGTNTLRNDPASGAAIPAGTPVMWLAAATPVNALAGDIIFIDAQAN